MISIDENALTCDFAESYNIYDFYLLPPAKTAVLALGLKDDSRIKKAMTGTKLSTDTYLLAMAVDALNWIVWSKTANAEKGKNMPSSILSALLGETEEHKENDIVSFDTPEEFMDYIESRKEGS